MHRVAVRDERVVGRVAGRLVDVLEAGDRVRAGVRDVDAGGAEADAGHRRAEHHEAARLDVVGVGDGAAQVGAAVLQRLRRPDVGDRVGALVGRPIVGAGGARARVERARDVRLGRVADDVEPGRGGDLGRERARQLGVDDRLRAAQVAVGMPLLTFSSGMSSTATVVASDPVPEVVGIARCGFSGEGGFLPPPTGALT